MKATIEGVRLVENQAPASRQELEIFDRTPDVALDELTELSAVLCNADYAYIGWMDFNRLWFKSRFGFDAPEQPRAATALTARLARFHALLLLAAAPALALLAGRIDAPTPQAGRPWVVGDRGPLK